MPDEQQPDPASGGVPHAYRNVVFWRWARELPRPLRGGFLKVLYALGTAANTRGEMRFHDGKAIRIQDIARGSAADEKDTRRYIDAAIAAGVVGILGTRRRGKPTVYQLLIIPNPDWAAAVASLAASQPVKKQRAKAAPWREQEATEFGGPSPEPDATEFGGPPPEPDTEGSGDRPRNLGGESSGDRPPLEFGGPSPVEFGGPSPEQPRVTQVLPQELAAVGGHLTLGVAPDELGEPPGYDEVDTTPDEPDPFDDTPPAAPPQLTLTAQERRDARAAEVKAKSAGNQGQMPLLLSVRDPEHVATVAEVRAAAQDDPEAVRRAIRTLGRTEAIRVYGHRLVFQHLRNDNTDTG
ncbi:hypothetical protein ACFCYM_09865 [Streptomyces sp. NPDC056254]|uniref:hypothetical protein n=1 Tax=Streptomyces sp. NPDC056254 TaxID=3345763 RepID=UPI0035DE5B52